MVLKWGYQQTGPSSDFGQFLDPKYVPFLIHRNWFAASSGAAFGILEYKYCAQLQSLKAKAAELGIEAIDDYTVCTVIL